VVRTWGTRGEKSGLGERWCFRALGEVPRPQAAHALVLDNLTKMAYNKKTPVK